MKIIVVLSLVTTLFLLVACDGSNKDVSTTSSILVIKCNQPIPKFTLGQDSNPSQKKVNELCECIWSELDDWGRKTATAMTEGKTSEISFIHKNGFSSKFGKSVRMCGGMEL